MSAKWMKAIRQLADHVEFIEAGENPSKSLEATE